MTAPSLEALGRASLSAAVMIFAVLALRLRFRRETPQRVFCLLWDIVLVRLLVLADIASPLSFQQLLANWRTSGPSAVQFVPVLAEGPLVLREAVLADETECAFIVEKTGNVWLSAGTLLAVLWLAGALACLAWLLCGHLRSRRVYAASLPVSSPAVADWQQRHPLRRPVQVRRSDRIASPLTYGVLYPVVLLPSGMDLSDAGALPYVLAHEYTHIRRFDALRKGLLALALCLHWFNPLVWAMHVLANRDIELACDEAVVRSGADRREYALALLRLEEQRGRDFLSGSSFSRNALEERIIAIMKIKKFSLAAVAAVLTAMCIATTVFATSAPGPSARENVHSEAETLAEGVISKLDKNGNMIYSADQGKTWMSEDRFHAEYGNDWGDGWQVEWWTAGEYAAWLEQEKRELQNIIGERAYTGGDGWFVWDQEKVDETIALYESILEEIRNGALYSKTIRDQNGNLVEDAALGSGGMVIASTFDSAEDRELAGDAFLLDNASAILRECAVFGLSGTAEDGLFYNGQRVRYFVDGASVGEEGYGIRYSYADASGTVDVHTLRAVIYNPDGSYNPMGNLVGLAATGDASFDPDLANCARTSAEVQEAAAGTEIDIPPYMEDLLEEAGGRTLQEIFSQYAPLGLTCTSGKNSFVNLFYQGQPVRCFADLKPDGSAFTYENPYAAEGGSLRTVYNEDGIIIGLTDEMLNA